MSETNKPEDGLGDGFLSIGGDSPFAKSEGMREVFALASEKMKRLDGIQQLGQQRHEAMQNLANLYTRLESQYSLHGGCGCLECKATEILLFDIRSRYGFPDNIKRSGGPNVYYRMHHVPLGELAPPRKNSVVFMESVELAVAHGFPRPELVYFVPEMGGSPLLWNHAFVKAIWPTTWGIRLAEMVLCEEPIRYLDTFLYAEWPKPEET